MKNERNNSKDRYFALYQRWKHSNLLVSTFCEQESIKYATFRYWVKKFESATPMVSDFTELKIDTFEAHASSASIGLVRFATGTTLSLHEWPDPAWLKALL